MSQHLESMFPNLRGNIETRHYPPPESIQFLLKIEKFSPMILLFIMCSGTLFRWANTAEPAWLTTVRDNRIYLLGGIFFFKYLVNSAASTGAFEVSYNGVPIFSKLRSGKQPADALQVFTLCCATPIKFEPRVCLIHMHARTFSSHCAKVVSAILSNYNFDGFITFRLLQSCIFTCLTSIPYSFSLNTKLI